MVFGECGSGKSTTLNKIVKILANHYFKGQDNVCKFKSMQSLTSVTSCLQTGSIGYVKLVDTPGLNDPDAKRSDRNIRIEMMKNLKIILQDPTQGISSFILSVMPNASNRITDTPV